MGSKAFVSRKSVTPSSAGGFCTGIKATFNTSSKWRIRFQGCKTEDLDNKFHKEYVATVDLVEVPGLSDPIILGMPFGLSHGGVAYNEFYVNFANIYIPRVVSPCEGGQVSSMSVHELPREVIANDSGPVPANVLCARG